MQTIEIYFADAIEKHGLFKEAAASLIQEISSLTPGAIDRRCKELTGLNQELLADKNHLCALMEFIGPGILDTSYVGEFQRALDKSIAVCDELYKEIHIYRQNLALDRE